MPTDELMALAIRGSAAVAWGIATLRMLCHYEPNRLRGILAVGSLAIVLGVIAFGPLLTLALPDGGVRWLYNIVAGGVLVAGIAVAMDR